ncbi:SAM-dependent methyltransferase [Frankia sp. R82]|uniref:SAM-dependent methyltransferase n=1 Tax=Frankia sp. R82 TaxID=2950553 RepID=UPI00204303FC|nr:SAM-dependent methyltransferase [Frankia sp. R82]MCM3883639.1 SAM-dependent methyltransferase [Frankia sp. R82]
MLTHARALLTGTRQGRTAYLDVDLRDTDRILAAPELHETLDLSRPVALSVIAIFHFIPDSDRPHDILAQLVDLLPSGSYVSLTHLTADFDPDMRHVESTYLSRGMPMHLRTRAEVERFLDGLEIVEPGLQVVHRWRPDLAEQSTSAPSAVTFGEENSAARTSAIPLAELTDAQVSIYGAVARKR